MARGPAALRVDCSGHPSDFRGGRQAARPALNWFSQLSDAHGGTVRRLMVALSEEDPVRRGSPLGAGRVRRSRKETETEHKPQFLTFSRASSRPTVTAPPRLIVDIFLQIGEDVPPRGRGSKLPPISGLGSRISEIGSRKSDLGSRVYLKRDPGAARVGRNRPPAGGQSSLQMKPKTQIAGSRLVAVRLSPDFLR